MPRWRYTVFRPCPFVLLRTTNITNKNYNANNLSKKTGLSPEKEGFLQVQLYQTVI